MIRVYEDKEISKELKNKIQKKLTPLTFNQVRGLFLKDTEETIKLIIVKDKVYLFNEKTTILN